MLRRLNSPERAAALEEARRIEQAASSQADAFNTPPETLAAPPKTASEVLFNTVTGFLGVPGLERTSENDFDGGRTTSWRNRAPGGGAYGGMSRMSGMHGMTGGFYSPAYDAIAGYNRFPDDSTSAAYHARNGDGSGAFGLSGRGGSQSYFMQRSLNYGVGWVNSIGEAAFTGLFDKGRARFNFMLDADGRVNGEGDALYPFYDVKYTTIFTQVGLRTMSGMHGDAGRDDDGEGAERWIGNFGIGQRWYPLARGDYDKSAADAIGVNGLASPAEGAEGFEPYDSGDLMLGYNIFFDNDFTRSHQRGGVGVEVQYDWVKLASNYYAPLSGWKNSYDFDGDFVEERPAKGWDVRFKGYLPFHRSLAVTGAYSQWYGDHVGMFSSSELEKDPKVWSYGLEYTPVPLITGFWNQRSTERGRSDSEFGIRLTYHFGMSWEDQTSHAKVADLRTVDGSRHDFVDRENRIILEYRTKNAFQIEFLGAVGTNAFKFRLVDGFGERGAGQGATGRVSGGATLADPALAPGALAADSPGTPSQRYIADGNGEFIVLLSNVTSSPTTLTIQAGSNQQRFVLHTTVLVASGYGLVTPQDTLPGGQTVTLTLKTPDPNTAIIWSVTPGLGSLLSMPATTNADGEAVVTLQANAAGTGTLVVRAEVNGEEYTVTITVTPAAPGVGTFTASNYWVIGGGPSVDLVFDGTPVNANKTIDWEVTGPGRFASRQLTTGSTGRATGRLAGISAGSVGPATVTVTVDGQEYSLTVLIGPEPRITASDDAITNGGTVTLTFDGSAWGEPHPVAWSFVSGPGELAMEQTQTAQGGSINRYYATALLGTHATEGGPIVVKATVDGRDYTYSLPLIPDTGRLTANYEVVLNGRTYQGLLEFTSSAASANQPVEWSIVSGPAELTYSFPNTDADGKATSDLRIRETGLGPVVIAAEVNGKTYTTTVEVIEPTLSSSASSAFNNGTIDLLFSTGRAYSDVSWQVSPESLGRISQESSRNARGEFTAVFSAEPAGSGPVTITALGGGVGGTPYTITVDVLTVQPKLTASASSVGSGGTVNISFEGLVPNAGKNVTWNVIGPGSLSGPQPTTDTRGRATAILTADAAGSGLIEVTATMDGMVYSVTVTLGATLFSLDVTYDRDSFVTADFGATATITATATVNGSAVPINEGDVHWEVLSSYINESWWQYRTPGATNGLTWGGAPLSLGVQGDYPIRENMNAPRGNYGGTPPTGAVAQLSDIVGSRTVKVKASMTVANQPYEAVATLRFGDGPLSVFKGPLYYSATWAGAGNICGRAGNPASPGYQPATNLPSVVQLQNISAAGYGAGRGAFYAANWGKPGDGFFWSGEAANVPIYNNGAYAVGMAEGGTMDIHIEQWTEVSVMCLR